MVATKIINVIKDDSFDEIFDLFKNSPAEEIIFILPKRSKAFKSEDHFARVALAAQEQSKKVSFLSVNPDTVALAQQHGFEILQQRAAAPRAKKVSVAPSKIKPSLAAAKTFDEASDDELIPDDTEAFDPHSTSDYTSSVINADEKSEGHDGDEEEVLEKDAHEAEKEANVPTGDGLEDGALDEPEEIEKAAEKEIDPDEADIDEREYIQPDENFYQQEETGELMAARKKFQKPDEKMQEIAEVWQHEPFAKSETVWGKRPDVRKQPNLARTLQPRSSRRIVATLTIVGVLVASGFVYITVGSAKIVITPFTKQLDFEMNAHASDQFSSLDTTFNKLPGQLFTVEKSVTQEFAATGQREVAQKAKGKITIYNTYGTTPQTLIATTRLQSSDKLIFRTLRTVIVPGMTVIDGKQTPGTIEVEVVADKPGSSYNIAPGRFTIPAFQEKADAARFEKFYGQSTVAMSGGVSGLAKVVTEEDYAKAKIAVESALKSEIAQALVQEASGLKIPNSENITITSTETSAIVDQAIDRFTVTMHGVLRSIGFKEQDMHQLVREYTIKNYDLTVLENKVSIEYTSMHFDETKGILELTMKITGNGYGQVQSSQIAQDLAGKGEADIVGYLKQAQGVAEAKVLLSPFWVKKVPKNKGKVQVQVQY